MTDEELVDRLRDGDREVFDLVYESYFRRIYHFVDSRLRNRADTEETVQEVFINIFTSIGSYRGDAPLAAWMFGLTRRTIASRFKRKQHPTVPLPDADMEQIAAGAMPGGPLAEPSPLEAYEYSERVRLLDRRLSADLSPEQRRLFELHHVENHTISEIATALDKSEDAIKSNLYRARKILLAR